MAVVAEVNDDADRWLRSVVGGRPLAGSVMQAAEYVDAITLRDGSVKANVQLLPFDGDAYGVFTFVESALLFNDSKGNERLSLTQRLMIDPMARSAAAELIATQGGECVGNARARAALRVNEEGGLSAQPERRPYPCQ